ncbi:MAG TPA: phage holin family protein [Coleofasciculaceae cyanobacterium]
MGFLLTTLMTALSLLVVDLVVPGVTIATFPAALLAAVSIGLVNGSIKPVLFILTLPINILTLGLFSLLLNGFCFWLASLVVPGFAIHGMLAMVLGPVVLSLVSTFLNQYVARRSAEQPLPEAYNPASLDAVK